MTSYIRRKIAQRVYELCKSNVSSAEHLTHEIKLKEKIYSKTEPIAFHLKTTPSLQIEANQELVNSFKGDEHINSVSFDDERNQLLFCLKPFILADKVIKNILQNQEFWKTNCLLQVEKAQKIIVEFSSPNIAKPFHPGHLRSTILGNFIARINQAVGHDVVSLNYLGDWGTQFALLNVGYKLMGSPEELARDPIGHLYKVYVSVNDLVQCTDIFEKAKAYSQKLENNDEKAIQKWKLFRELSVKHLQETYERLGIHFTEYHGESMYRENAIRDLLKDLKSLGLLTTLDGAQVVETNLSKTKSHVVLIKNDGTTLYLSRDLAAAIDRYEKYKFDQMYYVVESGQTGHFNALFHILKQMEKPWHEKLHHIKFGRIKQMSTRKGQVVFLKDILDEAKFRTLDAMQLSPNTKVSGNWDEVADILGTSAVIVNSMKFPKARDIDFDWNKTLTTKSKSGIQIQYCHARLCNLQKNCGVELQNDYDVNLLTEPIAIKLIHCLSRYEEILEIAFRELEPSYIVHYLFTLSNTTNGAVKELRVKHEESAKAQARLSLFKASQLVLNHAMKLIGLQPLNNM